MVWNYLHDISGLVLSVVLKMWQCGHSHNHVGKVVAPHDLRVCWNLQIKPGIIFHFPPVCD